MPDERKDRKPADVSETDLAQDRMGKNSLQGNDQENVRNERHAMPEGKRDPDRSVEESFRKMDKDVRARTDLNKGAGHGND